MTQSMLNLLSPLVKYADCSETAGFLMQTGTTYPQRYAPMQTYREILGSNATINLSHD